MAVDRSCEAQVCVLYQSDCGQQQCESSAALPGDYQSATGARLDDHVVLAVDVELDLGAGVGVRQAQLRTRRLCRRQVLQEYCPPSQ